MTFATDRVSRADSGHRSRIAASLFLVAAFTMASCSSIAGRYATVKTANDPKINADYTGIFPGLRCSADFFFFPGDISDELGKDLSPVIRAPIALLIGLPDIPFSLALDTVLLPFDLLFWSIGHTAPKEAATEQ